MKKSILSFLAIVMAVSFSNTVMAQTTATATNTASTTIIAPITITAGTNLQFGDIIAGAGEVTVAIDGNRTIPGDLLAGTQVGDITAATFDITGAAGYTYAITLPEDGVVTLVGESMPMAVKTFTSTTPVALTAGDNTISVGATLVVADAQPAGEYSGTFNVTVAYN